MSATRAQHRARAHEPYNRKSHRQEIPLTPHNQQGEKGKTRGRLEGNRRRLLELRSLRASLLVLVDEVGIGLLITLNAQTQA
jgi:hypothetical protein